LIFFVKEELHFDNINVTIFLECATPWAAPEFVALQKNKYNTHTHTYIYICLFDGVYRHFQQYFCYIVAVSFA
jgi:hypothetical protein